MQRPISSTHAAETISYAASAVVYQPSSVPLQDEDLKDKDNTETHMAVLESIEEATLLEGADVQEALLRSKVDDPSARDVLNSDGVAILRLTRFARSAVVDEAFAQSSALDFCRRRVAEAGCPWAGGARLLVPFAEEQVLELSAAGIELESHHVVALRSDKDAVELALQGLPRKS
jgi:hypothetical protein